MFNVPKFRTYLKGLIGEMTQADFAREKGITPEHLSRMMRSEKPGCPSKTTLRKIAGNSDPVYNDLLDLCGYNDREKVFVLETREEAIQKRLNELEDNLSSMTKGVHLYNSLNDFFDEYIMLYDTKNVVFKKGKKMEYDDGGHFGAEYSVVITAEYKVRDCRCVIYAVLYFSETKGGKIIVLDFALDGKSLALAGAVESEEMKKKAEGMSHLYLVKHEPADVKRILAKIFGDNNDEEIIVSEVGFGLSFSDSDISPEKAASFVSSHADICKNEKNTDALEASIRVANGEDPFTAFSEYNHPDDIGCGFGSFVADVMRTETGIGFTFYKDVRGIEDAPSAVIVERQEYPDYDAADLKEAARKYAVELGLDRYGECVVYVHDCIEESMKFDTETD